MTPGLALSALWAVVVVGLLAPWRRSARPLPSPTRSERAWREPPLAGTWRRRRAARDVATGAVVELPEVIDLFVLAVGSGLNVATAVATVAARSPPVHRRALTAAVDRVEHGERLGDALEAVVEELGEPVRPLIAALVASERYGVALLPSLERLVAEARADRRRRAETAARRVPVLLLFPLVLCVLPAFCLLTLAPLLAATIRSIGLG